MDDIGVIALALVLLGFLLYKVLSREPRAPRATLPQLTNRLELAELHLLRGEPKEARSILEPLEQSVNAIHGTEGVVLRARFQLQLADYAAWTGQRDAAVACLDRALQGLGDVDDFALATALRARAEAALGLQAQLEDSSDRLFESGQRALAREAEVRQPELRMRLVWVADRLARIEHARGHWGAARSLFETSVRLGETFLRPGDAPDSAWDASARELIWAHARRVASDSARDLGLTLASSGDRAGGIAWMDRAIALAEGMSLPAGQLAHAHALFARGTHEPSDAVEGQGACVGLLERAAASGLASGLPDGLLVASQVSLALAELDDGLGLGAKALEHYREACERVKGLTAPAHRRHAGRAFLALGHEYEARGDREHAIEAFAQVVAWGIDSSDAETRKAAANAAFVLHGITLERKPASEVVALVEKLEALVPTLEPGARLIYGGIAARSRGLQCLAEGDPDRARAFFERAEAIAREVQGPDGWRLMGWVASDLGKLAARQERWGEAEAHFRRALEAPTSPTPSPGDRLERAQVHLELAQAQFRQDRPDDAARALRRAFDLGRDTGESRGREAAAMAAQGLGELAVEMEERRRQFEIAARLGRLSGTERGRALAVAMDERLRELSG